ncbi:MAG TPA: single-stranded-DNA-specific exonuclease RecJ [Chloroflexi bacterium]|nr:single-stranded-DNA-specific exonuclease RecJ [Chloroflexota bacterium]
MWIEPSPVQVSESLREAVGGHPLVADTLARRGLTTVEAARAFLDPDQYRPAPPTDLPGAVEAAERLERAIRRGELICVWGDFDVDGLTSTATLLSTLQDLGAAVRYHIPTRQEGGHGVHLPALRRLIGEGVQLVLTCDTGVTAHEPVAYAQAQGVDVVITDHHDLPPDLPAAYAVVNPKMLPADHPLRELPGVGVAYKLAELLYERASRAAEVEQYLDLLALGIVADVATLAGDVRYLLQRGLERLRRAERLGLRVMMESADVRPDWLTEEHIGFELAPRLNALGRLADANVGVEFLSTADLARARMLAAELEGLNAQRKLLCDQVTQAAESQLERDATLLEQAALVLSHPSWPAGVVGIVAGRLAERYHKPTILIATPDGELGRGSARSVEGCDIHAAIAAQGEMLERFGGHPMAAGLSIQSERIPQFRRALSRTVRQMCADLGRRPALHIDGYLPLSDLSLDLVAQIERLAPFGPGNPPLTLASRGVTLTSHTAVGRSGEHLRLTVENAEGTSQTVLWWQGAGRGLPEGRFDLAYIVRASDYRGQRDVQVEWVDAREAVQPQAGKAAAVTSPAQLRVVDYRRESHPRELLDRLRGLEGEGLVVWSEAGDKAGVAGWDRYELRPARVLVIWTTPPGAGELRAALGQVSPEVVYLFGVNPGLDRAPLFLERLGGLVKRALKADRGQVSLSTLAAATAQREGAVRAGLEWLAARGHVTILEQDEVGKGMALAPGGRVEEDTSEYLARLKGMLEETRAYRAYFQRADAEDILPRGERRGS